MKKNVKLVLEKLHFENESVKKLIHLKYFWLCAKNKSQASHICMIRYLDVG